MKKVQVSFFFLHYKTDESVGTKPRGCISAAIFFTLYRTFCIDGDGTLGNVRSFHFQEILGDLRGCRPIQGAEALRNFYQLFPFSAHRIRETPPFGTHHNSSRSAALISSGCINNEFEIDFYGFFDERVVSRHTLR